MQTFFGTTLMHIAHTHIRPLLPPHDAHCTFTYILPMYKRVVYAVWIWAHEVDCAYYLSLAVLEVVNLYVYILRLLFLEPAHKMQ